MGTWLEQWNITTPLGKGGQGTTFHVTRKNDGQEGVIKILKHQNNEEARRRMFREVANLKTLQGAGCKVPQILDGNTEKFESKDIDLFFVMESISGQRLCDIVTTNGGLGLQKSVSIALDLLLTVKKALVEDVIHRDLKPENIIVRDFEQNDLVIVDYGLSFNATEDGEVTRASETLDNSFFSLPERRVLGGNRRDPRSEFTSICAILYYCITAKAPVDLIGPDGKAPHRRTGYSVKETLGASPGTTRLEMFFDRGFAPNIDDRYQSISEITSRLEDVLNPTAKVTTEDPKEIANRVGKLLIKNNRPVQIAEYTKIAQHMSQVLGQQAVHFTSLQPFSYENVPPVLIGLSANDLKISDAEKTLSAFAARLAIRENPHKVTICYQLIVKGTQCGVFRLMFKYSENVHPGFEIKRKTIIYNWEPILWYDGLVEPDWSAVVSDLKACVVEGMKSIEQDILSPGESAVIININ